MNINDQLHGFTLTDARPIPETGGEGFYFIHDKSGARLLYLKNDDDNKTFGVGFRTPSANSTGVAHILEHSVLNGSQKYRTKEPFMDLAKSSLATFLNAMTFSDKTIYPVASRNEKDFFNLMDVYLDAVFHPSIYTTPEVFLQEGWHYHLEDAEDPITYRGVVYNEMRGALSSADDQVGDAVLAALYPDTIYGCESGGDPYEIPSLTYDAFLDFHRTLYHPSNSYFFLYGDVDIDRALAHIHDGYLAAYDRLAVDSALTPQPRFEAPKQVETTFSVSAGDEVAGKSQLVYATLFGTRTNLRDLFLAELLAGALIDSQAGPLRQALMKANLGADVLSFSSDGLEIPFGVVLKDTEPERLHDFVQVLEDEVRRLIKEGLPEDVLLASLNKMEFQLREASGYATRGIVHYINAFESWLYDGSPFEALAYDQVLADLRADVQAGRLGQELAARFLDNPHKVILTARPEPGKNEARDAAVREELARYKESLSDEEIQALVAATHRLIERQNREDTEEERATLPTLSLADIDTRVEPVPREVRQVAGAEVHLHDIFTSGILYLDMRFDTGHIAAADLMDYSLILSLIGAMDAEEADYTDLVTREYLLTGGISTTPAIAQDYRDADVFYPRLVVSGRMLSSADFEAVFELLDHILRKTVFTDKERLQELIQMLRLRAETGIFQQGHAVASSRAKSYLAPQVAYVEKTHGLDFLFYLQELDRHFDEVADDLIHRLTHLYGRLLQRKNLKVGLTGSLDDMEAIMPHLQHFLEGIPESAGETAAFLPQISVKNEGIMSAAAVQYVAQAADLRDFDVVYNGRMEVLSNVLTNEYLYNEIRAKGGAYGQGIRFGKSGLMTLYSYRDPNLAETFAVYDRMADWLEALSYDEERLRPFIIGTMNRFNPAQTAGSRGVTDLSMAITGQTYDDVARLADEALATTVADLRTYAGALRRAVKEKVCCVLGGAARIQEEAALFDHLVRLENGSEGAEQ